MYQRFTDQEKNKKILKSVFVNYSGVGLVLAVSMLMLWEYNTKGYVSVKYHKFYGEQAKEIAWLTLFASLSMFIYFTLSTIKNLKKKSARDEYFNQIIESQDLICADCLYVAKHKGAGEVTCPNCGSDNVEELSGFFKRYPEKKIIDNKLNDNIAGIKSADDSSLFLGLAIFLALLGPTFIAYIVYILIINPGK